MRADRLVHWPIPRYEGCVEVYPVILFYKYVEIEDPLSFVESQKSFCASLRLKGRLLVAQEGINGTLAGPAQAVDEYVKALRTDPRFTDIEIKISAGDENSFQKLVVKARPEIVTLKSPVPLTPDRTNHLSPADWKKTIDEGDNVVLVDVRNRYESAAGKFEGAVACEIENFRDLPEYLERLSDLKEKNVLMYCTGGIRCEKASALFKSRGFQNVFQLHGGIMNYQKEFGNEHWLGECFVFDQRMTVRVEEDLVQIGRCAHSGRPSSRFVNCAEDLCHTLFILAEETERENAEYRYCPECVAKRRLGEAIEG
jgi:UPF0176 protein